MHRLHFPKLRWATLWAGLILFVVALGAGLLQAQDAPKRFPDAQASDCAACHAGKSPLPKDHPPVAGMAMKDCRECHAKGSPTALLGKIPLAHVHLLSGVGCAKCHADLKDPAPTASKECLKCHDMDKVAAATAEMKPSNPHDSPHYGKTSDCNLCHHQHEKSENYCAQCHSYKYNVP